ncbi:MAG TPA: TolC family protein, partial [Bordetella sp.]
TYSFYQLGAQASWELDVFGGLRRRREAAGADYAGVQDEADAVRLSVEAEVADTYLQLRGLQARFAIATRQWDTARQLADLVRLRQSQGLASPRELNRVVGEQAGREAALPPLRAAIAATLNRIDVLAGRQAGTGAPSLSAAAAIPLAPDPSGSIEPAMLLRRRPDIGAAERRLASAYARIGAALSEYYPQVSLGGLAGVAGVGAGNLWDSSAVQAGALLGVRWRLFDFGRIDAEVSAARGRQAEALAQYRGTVLRATEEVETAFSRLAEGRKEVAAGEREVAALTVSREQARKAYQGGVIALIDVLDADRALLDASNRLADAQAQAARASVAAIRALGGGWQEDRS